MGWLVFLQTPSVPQVTAIAASGPSSIDAELIKLIFGLAAAAFMAYLTWIAREQRAQLKEQHDTILEHERRHGRDEQRWAEEERKFWQRIDELNTKTELIDAFIDPLRLVVQQHLATALFKTNPFTPEENEATQRYLNVGADRASDADLETIWNAIARVLGENSTEIDKFVYGGILAGVNYERKRREIERRPKRRGDEPSPA